MLPCIVTCGGLCPGLNTVIRELVCGLFHMYNVNHVLGIEVTFFIQFACFNSSSLMINFGHYCSVMDFQNTLKKWYGQQVST